MSDAQEPGTERFEEWGVYLIGDSPLKAHGLALDDGSGDKKLLAEALEERLEDDEIDQLINDLIAYRVDDDGEDGTAIECEDCGHVRPTTEENPTLVNCQQCGSYNLRYKDDDLRADGCEPEVEQRSLDEHTAVDPNSVLSVLRDFERTEDDPARPLAVVQMEKYLFGAKPGSELRYGTVRNAMEQTDGRLSLRYDDEYGHGYLALVDGELSRLMKPEGFDGYNGPYGISVELLDEWLRNESVRLTVKEDTPFAAAESSGGESDAE